MTANLTRFWHPSRVRMLLIVFRGSTLRSDPRLISGKPPAWRTARGTPPRTSGGGKCEASLVRLAVMDRRFLGGNSQNGDKLPPANDASRFEF